MTKNQIDPIEIGRKIKTFRTLKGLSLDELAKIAGVHKTTISRVESGIRNPSAQLLAGLASIGMDIDNVMPEPTSSKKEIALYLRVSELEVKLMSMEDRIESLIKLIEEKL